jgi:uncharacterized protein YqgC (DUF456 family)
MSATELVGITITGLVMILGLVGTLVPGIPGAPLILIAAVGHKLYFGDASVSYIGLSLLILLTLISIALDFLAGVLGAKKLGATWRGMLGAIIGAIVGLFFSLPGLILGPLVGAFLFEFLGGRAWREAAKAGVGTIIGIILGTIGRIVCCVIMITVFGLSVLWQREQPGPGESAPTVALTELEGRPLSFDIPQKPVVQSRRFEQNRLNPE